MSIIWTLRKQIDSIVHREEEAAHKRDRTVARRQRLGDDGDAEGAETDGDRASDQRYICRVCGHLADDETYCPLCLADTMVPAGTAGDAEG